MGVLPLAGRTDEAAYAHSMNKMLEDVGVEPTDFLAVVSDHDARGVFSEVQQTCGWGSALGAGGAAVGVPSKYQGRVGAQRSRCKTCCEAGSGGGGICEHGALRFQCKNCREAGTGGGGM